MSTTYYTSAISGNWNDPKTWDTMPLDTLSLNQVVNIENGATVTIPQGLTVTLDNAYLQLISGSLVVDGILNINIYTNAWQTAVISAGSGNILINEGATLNIVSKTQPHDGYYSVQGIAMSNGNFINKGALNITSSTKSGFGWGILMQSGPGSTFTNSGTINTFCEEDSSQGLGPACAIEMRSGTFSNQPGGVFRVGTSTSVGSSIIIDNGASITNQGSIQNFGTLNNQGTFENSNEVTLNFPDASFQGNPVSGSNTTINLSGTISGSNPTSLSTITNSYEIPELLAIDTGFTLIIAKGQVVKNNGVLVNNGTIKVESGGLLIGNPPTGTGKVIEEPIISSFVPEKVVPGMWMEVTGTNFISEGKVLFQGGVTANFDPQSTENKAYVKIPEGAKSGSISVESNTVISDPSIGSLSVLTPPLIQPIPNPIFPPHPSGLMDEFSAESDISQSNAESDPNPLNIHETTKANSKDGTSFNGFVATTQLRKTLLFELNSPGNMHSHGGNWIQGGAFPSTPASSVINGISDAPAQTTDGDDVVRLVAVGGIPPTSAGDAGNVNFNSTGNPIFLSIDGGSTWKGLSASSFASPGSGDVSKVVQYDGICSFGAKLVAFGNGLTSTNVESLFYTVSNDGGNTWGQSNVVDSYSLAERVLVTSSGNNAYVIKKTSNSVTCFHFDNSSASPTPQSVTLPSMAGVTVELCGTACSGSKLVVAFIGSNLNATEFYYWFVEIGLNSDGSLGTQELKPIPTSGANSQNFTSLNGVWAPITLAYDLRADIFLAVSNNGGIWERSSSGWSLVKASNTSPVFNKSSTASSILVNADRSIFFISGIDIVAITLTY